jgi:putative intracellular protease/amidase
VVPPLSVGTLPRNTRGTNIRKRDRPARLCVVLYDGVEAIDVGGTIGVVSMAARILPAIEAITIAHIAGPVALAGGLTVVTQYGFADAPPCDVTIVCGGPGWRKQVEDAAMFAFLRSLDPVRAAPVCTGALILGAARLLNGRAETTRRQALGAETSAPVVIRKSLGPICGSPRATWADQVSKMSNCRSPSRGNIAANSSVTPTYSAVSCDKRHLTVLI